MEWNNYDIDELNIIANKHNLGEIMGSSTGQGDLSFPLCCRSNCWCFYCSMRFIDFDADDLVQDATFKAIKNFKNYLNQKINYNL